MSKTDDQCQEEHHQSSVHILTQEDAYEMASLFKVLSDPTRLRLLSMLINQEMCVGDLALSLEMEQSTISHQLRQQRVVKMRKQGKHALYTLMDEHILSLFQQSLTHIQES